MLSANWITDTLPRPPMYHPTNPITLSLKVSDLLVENTTFWNIPMLRQTFAHDDVDRILSIRAKPHLQDAKRWGFKPFGSYTSQSAAPLPPLEKPNLRSRGTQVDATCASCGHSYQTEPKSKLLIHPYIDLFPGSSGTSGKLETPSCLNALNSQLRTSGTRLWKTLRSGLMSMSRIIFEFSSPSLRDALANPNSHPELRWLFDAVNVLLQKIEFWCLRLAPSSENIAVMEIAVSVTRDSRLHFYVVCNGPSWLRSLLSKEAAT
ncbi:hypothetical protein Bca52824_032482 [Brassica carinata]|uniref:Uncharacterized protein n=1 Tax=Brassica carinata TaxID=52824 RepID=A0A8X7V8P6_BRACI|nr:hypothetical protein Bca52824_032482 [Brassica carinata]